jgi:hypothetical protein
MKKIGNRWKVPAVVPAVKGIKCKLNMRAERKHIGNIEIDNKITHCWTGVTWKVQRLQVILAAKPFKMALSTRTQEAIVKHIERRQMAG